MARLVRNGSLARTPNGTATAGAGVPRYAFISHPACCGKCSTMDSRTTGRLYSVGDTWRISHINCCCMTVEVPDTVGMAASAVQEFTANPVGGIARRGFNYGKSFAPVKLTEKNIGKTMEKFEKNAVQTAANGLRGKIARKVVVAQQKGAYRKAYNNASDTWNDVGIEVPKEQKKRSNVVKVRTARAEKPMFNASGSISAGASVEKKKKKKKVAQVAANRAASRETKSLAKLFGAKIK